MKRSSIRQNPHPDPLPAYRERGKRRARELRLSINASLGRVHIPFLRAYLERAWKLLAKSPAELSIALVNDRAMSDLHKQFMNIQGPTDVLTFPIDVAPNGQVESGEVVICVPEARRQAKMRGIPVQRELLLYALHGLLHLNGFDDRTGSDFRRMHAMEDDILTRLGVGPTFKPRPRTKRAAKAAGARG